MFMSLKVLQHHNNSQSNLVVPKMSMAKKAFSRLPKAIRPIKYHLRLKPDLAAFTFRGWMKVDLDVAEATDTIVCNAAELVRQQQTRPCGSYILNLLLITQL